MKKLLLPMMILWLAMPAISQTYLFVSGTVSDLSNGNPIPNHAVIIHNDSTSPGYFYNTVYTNTSGYYMDTIPVIGTTSGNLYVGTVDCQNYLQMQWFTYNPVQTNFTANFSICYNSSPCQAGFLSSQSLPLTVQFSNTSVGGNGAYQWNFGDGGTSTLADPVHTYPAPGYYNVSLTIGALGTTCYNTLTQTLYVWDSTATGCQAYYTFYTDTTSSVAVCHFTDQSVGNITSWLWDFGDPASGANNTSTLQNPVHSYSSTGPFTACLTINGPDSCNDVSCQTFGFNLPGDCDAAFTYYSDSVNAGQTVHFIDQSQGTIYGWYWNFGDPASGVTNTSTLQNPTHTFTVPGTYNVCLTIYGADSCQDVTCQALTINVLPNCQAAFTYYTDSTGSAYAVHFLDQSVGNITNWAWTFGDGSSSSEQNPVHVYPAPGYYLVSLTVSSPNQWCSDVVYDTIYVNGGLPCQASFVYNVNPSTGNRTVTFTDQSAGGPVSWVWSFGDGTSSTEQNPVHTYTGATVSYNVCLTITTSNSCTSTWCQTVLLPDSTSYNQVYGQVFAGNFPLTSGLAVIYSHDTINPGQAIVEIFPIDSNGVYFFTQIPDGDYYILAIPFDSGEYLPTYYGNTISWSQATLVSLGTPNNPYNIQLVAAGQMMPGNGSIGGQISQGEFHGAPTDLINMILFNNLGQAIGFTRVSASGSFSFPSLTYGTYILHPELPGVSADNILVILSESQPHAEIVMTYSGNKILGMGSPNDLVSRFNIFPNPATDHVSISLTLTRSMPVVAEIHNLTGQRMVSKSFDLRSGSQQIELSTAHLTPGIYTLRIFAKQGVNLNVKLVIR